MENGTFKKTDEIESILDAFCTEDDTELRVTDVPNLAYNSYNYYLMMVQTLARSKQEYLVEQNSENVYGLFLICEEIKSHRKGLVYVTDIGSEIVLDARYYDIDRVGNKIFQGFNEVGECVTQVYDSGYNFVDFSDMYLHDIWRFAGFTFYLVNNSSTELHNSEFMYVEVAGIDEETDDFTEDVEDVFILRSKDEYFTFFSELMDELAELYTQEEYRDLVGISNELCANLKM